MNNHLKPRITVGIGSRLPRAGVGRSARHGACPRSRAATPFIPLARLAIAIRGLSVVDGRIAETDIVADQARLHR
jgi:hypothetical protein